MDSPEFAIEKLLRMTKHDDARITERGNSAILAALDIVKHIGDKKTVLIPDQGGWISFKNYPKFLGLNVLEVKTDYGIIDIDDLKQKSKGAAALIFTSFAGYFAEQPLKKIAGVCHDNGCLVIEDASGAMGYAKLCNGNFSDMIVGSFSEGSSVSIGYGGFISVNKPEYFNLAKEVFSMFKVHPRFYFQLQKQLNTHRMKDVMHLAEKVKKDLKGNEILHKESEGMNIVVKYTPQVLTYCVKNRFPYILCPNYIRVNERAISIELKELSHKELLQRLQV